MLKLTPLAEKRANLKTTGKKFRMNYTSRQYFGLERFK